MRNGIDFKLSDNETNSRLLPNFLFSEDPICAIDLAEIKDLDKENLLPNEGMLLFYYDLKSNVNGRRFAADKKYYRVEYLPKKKAIKGGYGLSFKAIDTYPDSDDREIIGLPLEKENPRDFQIRMLGWPIINDNVTMLLDLNRRKFDLSKGLGDIAPYVIKKVKAEGTKWIMLLQINSIDNILEIGDYGSLYFYIREEDLKARDFSKCYMIREEC